MPIPGENSVRRKSSNGLSRSQVEKASFEGRPEDKDPSQTKSSTSHTDRVDISDAAKELNAKQDQGVVPVKLPADSIRGGITAGDSLSARSESGQGPMESISILREVPGGAQEPQQKQRVSTVVDTPDPRTSKFDVAGESFSPPQSQTGSVVSTEI